MHRGVALLGISSLLGLGLVVGGMALRPAELARTIPLPAPAAFAVDNGHSSVVYKITHLGLSNFYGRFDKIEGTFAFDPKSPETASFDVSIAADSVNSNNGQRDGHLKSPDFFNVKQFPAITFKSNGVTPASEGAFELKGDLTLLGETKPITAKLVHTGEKDAGAPFGYRAGFEATFTIKRSDFGMTYGLNNGALGDEVAITISIEGIKK